MMLLQAPAVSVAAAVVVDGADTGVAVLAGQHSVAPRCRAVEQQQDVVVAPAEISWLSFLQHPTNEVRSV